MAYGFDSSLQAPALPTPLSNDAPKKDSFTSIGVNSTLFGLGGGGL